MGHYDVYKDRQGYWRWRAIASNGKIIADSGEGYVHKSDCHHGIGLIANSSNWLVRDKAA
jgi:uncharacterized protein